MENRNNDTDDTFFNCSVSDTDQLSESQIRDVQQLVMLCCRHDQISLSYPVTGAVGEEASRHWLIYEDSGMLIAILGLVYYEDALAECTAFTHPAFRCQGLFEELLDLALEYCEERDILFPVSGSCPDTSAALQALSAELDFQEFQMEIELTASLAENTLPHQGSDFHFTLKKNIPEPSLPDISAPDLSENPEHADLDTWLLFSDAAPDMPCKTACGTCQTSPVSDSCVCLHHVEILPQFRRQGCGTALIQMLLSSLYQNGIRRVILQVSGDNTAALALYKKTGFRITETLSYYLY